MYKLKNCNLLNKSSRDLNWVATRIETHTARFTLLLLTALANCKPKPKSFYFADVKGNLTAVEEAAKMIIRRLMCALVPRQKAIIRLRLGSSRVKSLRAGKQPRVQGFSLEGGSPLRRSRGKLWERGCQGKVPP